MRIKLPDPPAHAAAKPQLHSQANHDAYDGALHIPLRTGTSNPSYLVSPFQLYSESLAPRERSPPDVPNYSSTTTSMTDTPG